MMSSKTLSVGYLSVPVLILTILIVNALDELRAQYNMIVTMFQSIGMPSTAKIGLVTLLGFIALAFSAVFSFVTYYLLGQINTASSSGLTGALTVIVGLFLLVLVAGATLLYLINRLSRVAR